MLSHQHWIFSGRYLGVILNPFGNLFVDVFYVGGTTFAAHCRPYNVVTHLETVSQPELAVKFGTPRVDSKSHSLCKIDPDTGTFLARNHLWMDFSTSSYAGSLTRREVDLAECALGLLEGGCPC